MSLRKKIEKVLNQKLVVIYPQIIHYLQARLNLPQTDTIPTTIGLSDIMIVMLTIYFAFLNLCSTTEQIMLFLHPKDGPEQDLEYVRANDPTLCSIKSFLSNRSLMIFKAVQYQSFSAKDFCQLNSFLRKLMVLLENDLRMGVSEISKFSQNLSTDYIKNFSVSQLEILKCSMETEIWIPADVFPEHITMVEALHNPSILFFESPPSTFKLVKLKSDEIEYTVTRSILILLWSILQYVQIISSIPSVSDEAAVNLLDIIKKYQTKSRSFIIGNEAVQASILTSINEKHLAVSSDGISFLIGELPHLRGRISLCLGGDDKFKESLNELKTLLQYCWYLNPKLLIISIKNEIS